MRFSVGIAVQGCGWFAQQQLSLVLCRQQSVLAIVTRAFAKHDTNTERMSAQNSTHATATKNKQACHRQAENQVPWLIVDVVPKFHRY